MKKEIFKYYFYTPDSSNKIIGVKIIHSAKSERNLCSEGQCFRVESVIDYKSYSDRYRIVLIEESKTEREFSVYCEFIDRTEFFFDNV